MSFLQGMTQAQADDIIRQLKDHMAVKAFAAIPIAAHAASKLRETGVEFEQAQAAINEIGATGLRYEAALKDFWRRIEEHRIQGVRATVSRMLPTNEDGEWVPSASETLAEWRRLIAEVKAMPISNGFRSYLLKVARRRLAEDEAEYEASGAIQSPRKARQEQRRPTDHSGREIA